MNTLQTPSNKAPESKRKGLLHEYIYFFRLSHISKKWLAWPICFGLLASLCEGASVSLLVPLLTGIIQKDYSFITQLPIIGEFASTYIEPLYAGNRALAAFLVFLTFLAAAGKVIFQYLATISTAKLVRTFTNRLRKRAYERYLSFGKLYFDKHNIGHMQQVLSTYLYRVTGAMSTFQNTLYGLMMLAVYTSILFYLSWKLSLIVITVFPCLHLLLTRVMKQIQKASEDQTRDFTSVSAKLTNALSTIPLVKAYNNEKQELGKLSELSDRIESLEISMDKKTNIVHPIQELVALTYLLLLVILIGAFIKIDSNWHIANYTVFLFVLMRTSRLFGVFNALRSTIALSSGPLNELITLFDNRDKHFITDGSIKFEHLQESLECQNLEFTFPGGSNAIRNCSCMFAKGKTTALVGASGAGKSTILNLLMRFYEPPRGQIFVDGVDLNDLTLTSWRDRIALISQDAHLFHDTVRENLLYGLTRTVSDEELKQIISESKLTTLLDSLPQGLETHVGDRGVKLSGGEKQRISIARAMLKHADILFLDEATSALDSKTEREIQASLDTLTKDKTTIVIAHRLSTIRNAHHIIVLEAGTVVEQGALDDLLNKKGHFFEYWEQQKV